MIHVYAFAERLDGLPTVAGLDDALVETTSVEEVDAVFSRRAGATPRDARQRDALTHGAVVEALRDRADAVLPVRFGEVLSDEASLAQLLRDRLPSIRRSFDQVRGCVEIGVHVHDLLEPVAARPASGTDYMRLRAAEELRRRESIDALHGAVSGLARDARLERDRFAGTYLVAADRLDDVHAAVNRFANEHTELAVVCTGPWAPFSFGSEAA